MTRQLLRSSNRQHLISVTILSWCCIGMGGRKDWRIILEAANAAQTAYNINSQPSCTLPGAVWVKPNHNYYGKWKQIGLVFQLSHLINNLFNHYNFKQSLPKFHQITNHLHVIRGIKMQYYSATELADTCFGWLAVFAEHSRYIGLFLLVSTICFSMWLANTIVCWVMMMGWLGGWLLNSVLIKLPTFIYIIYFFICHNSLN